MPDDSDLMLLGKMTAGLANGRTGVVEFVARVVTNETGKGLRIKLYRAWGVRDTTAVENVSAQGL